MTLETSGLINFEISSQISGKLEIDLNCQILEVINSAVAEKVLPSTENAVRPTKTTSNTKWDLRSDGPHSSQIGQIAQECDPWSNRPLPSKIGNLTQEPQKDVPRLITTSSNRNNHCREISVDSHQSDDGYDMYQRSSYLHRGPKFSDIRKPWENYPKFSVNF